MSSYGYKNAQSGPVSYIRIMWAVAGGVVIGGIFLGVLSLIAWYCAIYVVFSVASSGHVSKTAAAYVQSEERPQDRTAERAESQTGKGLLHRCQEWSRNAGTTPTETTRREAGRWCNRYSEYVSTGSYNAD